jgi:hypothetical protein
LKKGKIMKRVKTVKRVGVRQSMLLAGLILVTGLPGAAQAALQGRDLNGSAGSFEAYYDTGLNITWLADANASGLMKWADANAWAASLSIVDTVNNITYDNWRLPAVTDSGDPDCDNVNNSSATCTVNFATGEMANLDTGVFTNLQAGGYWSATEHLPPNDFAWVVYFSHDTQGAYEKSNSFFALAVSPGDVAAVPEADTWGMLLAGLGLVGFATRRRALAQAA